MDKLIEILGQHYPGITISLTIAGLILKYLGIPLFKWIKNMIKVVKEHDSIRQDLSVIVKELKPNGGSSLKDCINRIEDSLHLQSEKYRVMLGMNEMAIFETDSKGYCTYANRYYCDLTGLSQEEAMGYGWLNAIHEEDRDCIQEAWEQSVQQGREFKSTHRVLGRGRQVSVKCHAFPMRNKLGQITSYQGKLTKLEPYE